MNHNDTMHKLRDIAYYMEKLKELGVCWRISERPVGRRYHITVEQISIKEVYLRVPIVVDHVVVFYRYSINPKLLHSLHLRVSDDPHFTFHATKEEAEEAVVLEKMKGGEAGV